MKFKKPLLLAVLFISMIMLTACTKTDNGMVYEDATARAATDDGVAENVTDDTTVDAADDATDDAAVDAAANAQIENAPNENEQSESGKQENDQAADEENPINQYTGNEKSDLSGENAAGLTKEEMAEIAEGLGNVCVSEYRDFDQDGMYEEFVATGEPDDMGGYLVDAVWFIGSDGTTTKVGTDFKGLSLYASQNGYFMDYSEEGKGFFYADCGGYGSGWLTFVFGVKDGKPYELDISMKIQGFYQDEPGIFTTTTDDFTEYHKYLITELNYDKNTEQFDIGKVTDQDRYGE